MIETITKVVTAQRRKPNRALTKNAEIGNREIERELIEVGEVLDELKYLVRLEGRISIKGRGEGGEYRRVWLC